MPEASFVPKKKTTNYQTYENENFKNLVQALHQNNVIATFAKSEPTMMSFFLLFIE